MMEDSISASIQGNERVRTLNLAMSQKVLCFIQGVSCFILIWMWYNLEASMQYSLLGGVYFGLIGGNVAFALVGFGSALMYDLPLCMSYIIFLCIKMAIEVWMIFYTTFYSMWRFYWILSLIELIVGALYILIAVLFAHAISKYGAPSDIFIPSALREERQSMLGYDNDNTNSGILLNL